MFGLSFLFFLFPGLFSAGSPSDCENKEGRKEANQEGTDRIFYFWKIKSGSELYLSSHHPKTWQKWFPNVFKVRKNPGPCDPLRPQDRWRQQWLPGVLSQARHSLTLPLLLLRENHHQGDLKKTLLCLPLWTISSVSQGPFCPVHSITRAQSALGDGSYLVSICGWNPRLPSPCAFLKNHKGMLLLYHVMFTFKY